MYLTYFSVNSLCSQPRPLQWDNEIPIRGFSFVAVLNDVCLSLVHGHTIWPGVVKFCKIIFCGKVTFMKSMLISISNINTRSLINIIVQFIGATFSGAGQRVVSSLHCDRSLLL